VDVEDVVVGIVRADLGFELVVEREGLKKAHPSTGIFRG
jgi:hypothetical protein